MNIERPLNLKIKDAKAILYVEDWPTVAVPEEKFVGALLDNLYPDLGILPPIVRWISSTGKFVLLERPPTVQTIRFHAAKPGMAHRVPEHSFDLPMPWTLYAIELDEAHYPVDVSIYALQRSLESDKDILGVLPLVNHYRSGALCMPSRDYTEECADIGEGINAAYRIAWMSGFNLDMNYNVVAGIDHGRPRALFGTDQAPITPLELYEKWEKLDKATVANFKDWLTPQGYGHGPNVIVGGVNRVRDLIAVLENLEHERIVDDPIGNLAITMKQAISSAHLR